MAWSRKALNLISALHSTSGLGVRPAWYSRRNSANTRSLYSAAKLTCSISMPITSATAAASTKSTLRRAVLAVVVVFPVLHEDADDLVALLLEQVGADGGVHAAAQSDDDALLALIGAIIPVQVRPHALPAHSCPPTCRDSACRPQRWRLRARCTWHYSGCCCSTRRCSRPFATWCTSTCSRSAPRRNRPPAVRSRCERRPHPNPPTTRRCSRKRPTPRCR